MLGAEKWIATAVLLLIVVTLGLTVGSFVITLYSSSAAYGEVLGRATVGGVAPLEWLGVFHDTINFPVGKYVSVGAFLASVTAGFIGMSVSYWTWRLARNLLST